MSKKYLYRHNGAPMNLHSCFPKLASLPGALEISNNHNVASLPAFPLLTAVGTDSLQNGFLHISANTGSFDIPSCLQLLSTIGRDLEIKNNSQTVSMSNLLPALTSVHKIKIHGNSSFQQMNSAFPSLTSAFAVEIHGNSSMTTMNNFATNLVLQASGNYPYIELYDNTSLTSMLNGFASVSQTNYVEMYNNSSLQFMSGAFNSWITGPSYNYLEIYDCGPIDISNAFQSLQHTRYIEIYNSSTTSLAGAFPALTTIDYVEIFNSPNLVSISNMCPLLSIAGDTFSYVEINNNGSLASLGNCFPSLVTWPAVRITGNNSLTSIDGFRNWTTSVGFSSKVKINNNSSLLNIDGFSSLSAINVIEIDSNASLVNILVGLNSVIGSNISNSFGSVSFTNNLSLHKISQIKMFIDRITSEGFAGSKINSNNFDDSAPACAPFVLQDVTNMFSGDIVINTDADIFQFSGYDGITGSLSINDGVTSLIGLEGLRYIGGDVYISGNTTMSSLTGLDNLTTIVGYLGITNNSALTSLAALNKLHTVGYLDIENNSVLTSLDSTFACLDEITQISNRSLTIYGSSLLSATNAFVNLTSVPGIEIYTENLATLPTFDSLITCSNVYLGGGGALHNTGAFPVLSSISGDLYFGDGSDGTEFPTFASLASVGGALTISGITGMALGSNPFPSLTTVFNLNITNNTALITLSGAFANLSSITSALDVSNNDLLTDVNCFSNVTSVSQSISIRNNFSMTSIVGLDNVVSIGSSLSLQYCPLTLLSCFPALISINGTLTLQSLSIAPTSMANAFPLLTTIGSSGTLQIQSNYATAFSAANAFPSLTTAGSIKVNGNSGLTSIDNFCALWTGSSINDVIEIQFNGNLLSATGMFSSATTICAADSAFNHAILMTNLPNLSNMSGAFSSLQNSHGKMEFFSIGATALSFPSLTHTVIFDVQTSPSLTNVSMPLLTNTLRLSLIQCPVSSINFSSLITVSNALVIDTTNLTSMNAFSALTAIRNILDIESNALLTSVAALQNVNGANFDPVPTHNQFIVKNNTSLSKSAQITPLLTNLQGEGAGFSGSGSVQTTGNAP